MVGWLDHHRIEGKSLDREEANSDSELLWNLNIGMSLGIEPLF